ncbi:hypothetical protein AX16_004777 [Volvariella volvacea WC 439]|nr:hypothetical protein AX16_004777 [Volvariella volvacea WC 439]
MSNKDAPAGQTPADNQGNQTSAASTSSNVELYQVEISQLSELASAGHYREIVDFAERADISLEGDNEPGKRFVVVAPLTLAYLILNDLPPARFTLARLPEALLTHALPKLLFSLVAATWDRKHTQVYVRAQSLIQLVTRPDFFNPTLGSLISAMVLTFAERFRERTFSLIASAFTSISVALLQSYLGLTSEQLLPLLAQKGWEYNATTQIVVPGGSGVASCEPRAAATLKTFHVVTDSVAKLEF